MKEKNMKKADRITSVVIMALSVYGFIYSNKLKGDAGVLPKIIFIALMLGAVALFGFSFSNKSGEDVEKVAWKKWLVAVSGAILYVVLMNIIGFYIASVFYLAATMFSFGVRNKKILILTPVVFDLAIWICFGLILNISLPASFLM